MWASGRAEIIDKPAYDKQFARQQLAKDFNITKICLKAFAGGVLEFGFGATCKSVVEDDLAAYALVWSVKGDKITDHTREALCDSRTHSVLEDPAW